MEKILKEGWGITPDEINVVQSNVWKIREGRRYYALKESTLKERNLTFICEVERGLPDHGFFGFAPLIPAENGRLYFVKGNRFFSLHRWLFGEHCDFTNTDHLFACARTLGEFHLRVGMPDLQKKFPNRCRYFQRGEQMIKKRRELADFRCRAEAEKQKGGNRLYCAYFPDVDATAERAIDSLYASDYHRLAAEAMSVGALIHYDVAARNFIMMPKEAFFIDFDYCCFDLPMTDLMRLCKRSLKHGPPYEEKLRAIIEGYGSVRPLTVAEGKILCAMVSFPQKLWRLAHRHYVEGYFENDGIYAKKLCDALDEWEREKDWFPLLAERWK